MRIDRHNLAFAAGALGQNFVSGAALVALAWTALEAAGGYEAVGIVFLVGNMTNLFVGPFLGVLVDRFDRRDAFLAGALASSAALVLAFAAPGGVAGLYFVMFAMSVGGLLQGPSLESLLQKITPPGELAQIAAVRNLLRQIGLVGGAGISGALVAASGPALVFAISIAIALSAGIAVRALMPAHRPASGARRAYFAEMADGMRHLRRADIRRTGTVIVAAWSAGQAVNAALAGLARQRGFDATVYGIGDAFWSVGAFVTALWLARILGRRQPAPFWATAGVGGLGLGLAALSFAQDALAIFAACAVLGVFFSLAKVLSDSRFVVICEKDVLGRVRSNLNALSGAMGVIVYLAPTVLGLPADAMVFAWGVLLLAAFAALVPGERR